MPWHSFMKGLSQMQEKKDSLDRFLKDWAAKATLNYKCFLGWSICREVRVRKTETEVEKDKKQMPGLHNNLWRILVSCCTTVSFHSTMSSQEAIPKTTSKLATIGNRWEKTFLFPLSLLEKLFMFFHEELITTTLTTH